MNKNNQEIEIKIKIGDPESLFKLAVFLGGEELKEKEGLEHDVMYDDGHGFYDFPKVLRLRTAPFGNLLTYKEKNKDSDQDNYLIRTEIETFIKDPVALNLIIEKLGYKQYRVKEKYVRKVKLEGLVVEFHKLPFIGDYIEIEGDKSEIEKILEKLGLNVNQGINKDYSELYYEFCEMNGLDTNTPQTFDEEKKYGLQK
jgi:predicted adenylyl cyclase CyaB